MTACNLPDDLLQQIGLYGPWDSVLTGSAIHWLPAVRQKQRNPVFVLTWTLIHRIDATSPLYGRDQEALVTARSRITVSIFGHYETIASSVYVLHEYPADQLFFDYRFVEIISDGDDGTRIVDLTRSHDIAACEARSC